MADLVNWDGTTSADVVSYLAANPPPPSIDWGQFWLSPSYAMDVLGNEWNRETQQFIVQPVNDAVSSVETGISNAAADATKQATSSFTDALPYFAVGGLLLFAIALRRTA